MDFASNISGLGPAGDVLLNDCVSKLCTVPFPVQAARAEVVMHYEPAVSELTLLFACNALIHKNRITPPTTLRLNGVPTRKYAVVPCNEYAEDVVSAAVQAYTDAGYYAYTAIVNGNVKMYVSWDERCIHTGTDVEGAE